MARLNESTAPLESVEALKRRFVRQNREIARVNSSQSLRIRNLESEISRLLSENLSLREQVIKLQNEFDESSAKEGIVKIKEQLESKLTEFGKLVQGLGTTNRRHHDMQKARRESRALNAPKRSPDQREWKNTLSVSDAISGIEGRLPPIVEGKCYPRRTLDAEELGGMLSNHSNETDSPDLGPPPVTHFDDTDPIKFDASHAHKQASEIEESLHPTFLTNLETRRKKRANSYCTNAEAVELDPERKRRTSLSNSAAEQHLKAGAKRKFNAGEEDERAEGHNIGEKEDFHRNRPSGILQGQAFDLSLVRSGKSTAKLAEGKSFHGLELKKGAAKDTSDGKAKPSSTTINGRKALGPKNVNTDPVLSPRKADRHPIVDKDDKPKDATDPKPRDRNRGKEKKASERFARPSKESNDRAVELKHVEGALVTAERPPETPATQSPAPVSPVTSRVSAPRNESRDTPPPADLDDEAAGDRAFGSMGRASRRRGAVSYAEPNLRDKMRRPTKQLVDAVGVEERQQHQAISIKSEDTQTASKGTAGGVSSNQMRTVMIKREATADESVNWKSVPLEDEHNTRRKERAEVVSPAGNKKASRPVDLPSSVVTERRRRPSMLDRTEHPGHLGRSTMTSGPAMAAPVGNNQSSQIEQSQDYEKDVGEKEVGKLESPDIYDLQDSTLGQEGEGKSQRDRDRNAGPLRVSRRHSSVSSDRMKDAMARRAERRREASKVSGVEDGPAGSDLKSVRSATQLLAESNKTEPSRGERIASRRRSMML